MPEFGANGAILNASQDSARDYASEDRPKIRRVLLACFLCGIAASITVALIAGALAFAFSSITSILGMPPSQFDEANGFMTGAFVAVMMSAFNWYLFFIVIPITWIVFLFSLGRFPRRRITRSMPYYRWGAIWGAILVGGTTGVFTLLMQNGAALGGLLTGLVIGTTAGIACAGLFLAIVRPQKQIAQIEADVF